MPTRLAHLRRSTHLRACVALFLLLTIAYSASIGLRASRGASITGDEPFYLATTQSLIQDGDLDLRQQYARESYRSFFDHAEPLWRQADPLPDGRLLSPHQPGLSVLLIPGFALGGLLGAQVQLLLIAATAFTLAYHLASRATEHRALAWLATAVVALSPPAFVYATEVYPETPAALCIVLAVILARPSDRGSVVRTVAFAGVLTALAWLGMKYIPVALVLAAFYLWRSPTPQRAWLVGLGSLSAATYVGWHMVVFGALTPYQTNLAYEGASAGSVVSSHLSFEGRAYRFWGLFIDRRFGIGRWAPIFLAVWPALVLAWGAFRGSRLVVSVIVTQILVATFLSVTMMGWWFPGRMLVAVMPLMAVVLAVALARAPRPVRALAFAAGAYSLLVTALLVAAARGGEVVLAVDPFQMSAWPFRAVERAFPLYTWWSEETIALNAVWLTAGLVVIAVVAWRTHGDTWLRPQLRRRSSPTSKRCASDSEGRTDITSSTATSTSGSSRTVSATPQSRTTN